MRAVIVAAGLSSRLHPLTETTPKGLLEVGERRILDRSLDALAEHGIEDVLVVVGCHRDQMESALGARAQLLFNPFYRETNNMGSLWMALEHLDDEALLYLHGDLVYEPAILARLLEAPPGADIDLLVDSDIELDEEAMKVRVEGERVLHSSKEIPLPEASGEWIGIARFSATGVREMRTECARVLEEREFQVYDTAALNRMIDRGVSVRAVSTFGHRWVEVDFREDLERARTLFGGGAP